VIHLRIIAPAEEAHQALELLCEADSVLNVVHIHGASRKPAGDVISVTTIPAAANIGVGSAYGDWNQAGGAALQLAINLTGIVAAGVLTLAVQRRVTCCAGGGTAATPRARRPGSPD
jgi:Domain of unknown function (DUF389)